MSGNNSVGIIKLINDDNIAYVRLSYISHANQSVGSKLIVLNDHITDTIWEQPPAFINQVLISTEVDDVTIYNNGLGYKDGYRIRSGGAEGSQSNASCTGYIKAKQGETVRMSGWDLEDPGVSNAINVYDASHNNLGQITPSYPTAGYGLFTTSGGCLNYGWGKEFGVKQEKAGVYAWTLPPVESIAYIRVTGYTGGDGSKMIVTINEDIEL